MKLLLIAVHGLNNHWPGPYGNEWVATPRLDALAAESFVFDHHFCTIPTAAGFRQSWQTAGRPGPELSAELQSRDIHTLFLNHTPATPIGSWSSVISALPGENKSLWSLARQASKSLAGHDNWFALVETAQLLPPWTIKPEAFANHAKLSELGGESNPLTPWPAPEPGEHVLDDFAWERLRLSFACAVEELDRDITLVRNSFFPKPDDEAIIIVVGTHGYPLGEHHFVGPHATAVYGEEVHVPLWISSRDSRTAPRRIAKMTLQEDLYGTICEAFGFTAEQSLLRPASVPERASILAERETAGGIARYFRIDDWSYVLPAGTRLEEGKLFSQPDDRWETMNFAHTQPGTVDEIIGMLTPPKAQETNP